jgi:Fur family transcriptional regulator, ferric uptake regulator
MILILIHGYAISSMARGQMDPGAAEARLRTHGLRPTPRRVAVVDELLREPNDVTAQQLYDRLRAGGQRIGLATVYRTLAALVRAGAIELLSHSRDALCYRACQEGHHHHLVCSECHSVTELVDCELEEPLAQAAAEHGFLATGHQLEVTGVCGACAVAQA